MNYNYLTFSKKNKIFNIHSTQTHKSFIICILKSVKKLSLLLLIILKNLFLFIWI